MNDWTDEQFAAWLAGFFDGEGCIYLPKNGGVALTLANTNEEVIRLIHRRLRVGIVSRTTFVRVNWKPKFLWTVRNYPHANLVLRLMRPFLVIKAQKADKALAIISPKLDVVRRRFTRNMAIRAALERGEPRAGVAVAFNVSNDTVWRIANGRELRDPDRPRRDTDIITTREIAQTITKEKVKVSTTSERLAWSTHIEAHPRRSRGPAHKLD